MSITIELKGLDQVVDRLNRFTDNTGGGFRNDILKLIGNQVRDQTVTRIAATGLDPSGKPWAPLSPQTVARKRHGSRTMVDTGRLMSSVAMDVVGDEARISIPVPYAAHHQSGTSKMPQRQLVGLEGQHLQEVVETIDDFITDLFRG